jgi:hypothetical protein
MAVFHLRLMKTGRCSLDRGPHGASLVQLVTILATALCVALAGCSLMINLEPLEVTDWSPRSARVDASKASEIWVEFSAKVNATKTEQAFSFSENGAPATGSFSWKGNRLVFVPLRPVTQGNDYEIAVLSTAETRDGNSLAKDFRFAFSTRLEDGRPSIVSADPADGSRVADLFIPIVVRFSEPIDSASFIASFSVSPDPGGTISFDHSATTASFTPLTAWKSGTEYDVVVGEAVKDLSGNHLPNELRFRFTAGAEEVRPVLLSARHTVNGSALGTALTPEDPDDPVLQINTGFEADWGIELQFSEPVSRENIESFIEIVPAWGFQIDPAGGFRDRFLLAPKERFAWGSLYVLTVKHGVLDASGNPSAEDAVFTIRADGTSTRPPRVERVRFRIDPADSVTPDYEDFQVQDAFSNLDLSNFIPGVETDSYFDVYLRLADGATVDPFSLMLAFSVTATNGAALVTPVGVATTDFADPQPDTFADLVPVRVSIAITNTTSSGIITVAVSDGLADNKGNRATAAFSVPLLK